MAAGKLAHQEFPRVAWNMTAQIWLPPAQVKLFSGANGRRMVEQVAHWNASLAVGQHRWIANMRVTIESAESKPLPGIKKFTPGRVPRHPAHLQCVFRRELESVLHGNCNGTPGSK